MSDFSMTRGDTESLRITVYRDGEEYALQDGDKLVFTLKQSVFSKNILLQKNFIDNEIKIEHEDTKDLNYGTYYYDVQLTFANGDVQTVIKPSKFILTDEVNYD